jgi:hypothetical protein
MIMTKEKSFLIILSMLILSPVILFWVVNGTTTKFNMIQSEIKKNLENNLPSIDGVIESNEYSSFKTASNNEYQLYWQIHEEMIYWGILAEATGWIAIGFEPTTAMKDADMIFGWVDNDEEVEIRDCYSVGTYGPHPPDIELGGTSDISIYNGTEESGITVIEFSRSLITGDEYDKDVPKTGSFNVIWSFSNSDDFNQKHSKRGGMVLDMSSGEETSSSSVQPITSTIPASSTSYSSEIDIIPLLVAISCISIIYGKFINQQ